MRPHFYSLQIDFHSEIVIIIYIVDPSFIEIIVMTEIIHLQYDLVHEIQMVIDEPID